ncbi:hypothetical protein D1872_187280 [compost metagenome]
MNKTHLMLDSLLQLILLFPRTAKQDWNLATYAPHLEQLANGCYLEPVNPGQQSLNNSRIRIGLYGIEQPYASGQRVQHVTDLLLNTSQIVNISTYRVFTIPLQFMDHIPYA